MRHLKKELIIYFIVLLAMAAFWHNSTLLERMARIHTIHNPFHPLEWGMVGYLVLWIPRGVYLFVKKIAAKVKSDTPSD